MGVSRTAAIKQLQRAQLATMWPAAEAPGTAGAEQRTISSPLAGMADGLTSQCSFPFIHQLGRQRKAPHHAINSPVLGQHGSGLEAAQAARQLVRRQHLQRHGLEAVLGQAGRLGGQPLFLVELRVEGWLVG